jgi:hypothetical protein
MLEIIAGFNIYQSIALSIMIVVVGLAFAICVGQIIFNSIENDEDDEPRKPVYRGPKS